jgi:hypothetical protein
VKPLPAGKVVEISGEKLRGMSISELIRLAQELGISLEGVEERVSAVLTRLMAHAHDVKPG